MSTTLQSVGPDLEEGEISETEIDGQQDFFDAKKASSYQPLADHLYRPDPPDCEPLIPPDRDPDEPVRTYASAKARKVMARSKRGLYKSIKPRSRPIESSRDRDEDRTILHVGREVYGTIRSRRWQQERRLRPTPIARPRADQNSSHDESKEAPPEPVNDYYHHPLPVEDGHYEHHEAYHKPQAEYSEPTFEQASHQPPSHHHPQEYEPNSYSSYQPTQNAYEVAQPPQPHPCQPPYASHIPQPAQLSTDFTMPQHFPQHESMAPPYYANQPVYAEQNVVMESRPDGHDPYYHPEPLDHHLSSQHSLNLPHHQMPDLTHESYHPHSHSHHVPSHQPIPIDDPCRQPIPNQDHQLRQQPEHPQSADYPYDSEHRDSYPRPPSLCTSRAEYDYEHSHHQPNGCFQSQLHPPIEDSCRSGQAVDQAPIREHQLHQLPDQNVEYAYRSPLLPPHSNSQPVPEYEFEHQQHQLDGPFQSGFHHVSSAPLLHPSANERQYPSHDQALVGTGQFEDFRFMPPSQPQHRTSDLTSNQVVRNIDPEEAEARSLISNLINWGVTALYLVVDVGVSKSLVCKTFDDLGIPHNLMEQQNDLELSPPTPPPPPLKTVREVESLRADLELIFSGGELNRVRMLKEDLQHICPTTALGSLDHAGELYLADRVVKQQYPQQGIRKPLINLNRPRSPSPPKRVRRTTAAIDSSCRRGATNGGRGQQKKVVAVESLRRPGRKRRLSEGEEVEDSKEARDRDRDQIKIRVRALDE